MSDPTLLGALLAGVLSFLSPCVLPLVPGYISLISGLSAQQMLSAENYDRARLAFLSVFFVLGFTIVFVAYGAAASSLGVLVSDNRQVLTYASGALMVVMGIVIAGIVQPSALMGEHRFRVSPEKWGPYAAPVMGMAFAFGWTPCIGPILAGVLALAASRETLDSGVQMLLAYSLGLGIPFVATALAWGRLRSTWRWVSRHGKAVDRTAGALLIAFGLLVLTNQLTRVSGWVVELWSLVGLDRILLG